MKKQSYVVGPGYRIASKRSPNPPGNPLTKTGRKVLTSMQKSYGAKKGKQVFYATMNKRGKRWHK